MNNFIIDIIINTIAVCSVIAAFIYYVSIFQFGKDGCKPIFYFALLLILYAIFGKI